MELILGRIEEKGVTQIKRDIAGTTEEIEILIESGGGNILLGIELYETILSCAYHVTGIVKNEAKSAALIVLQGCYYRHMTTHAKLTFHSIMVKKEYQDIDEEYLRKVGLVEQHMADIIARRSKISPSQAINYMRSKKELNAKEALALGLIDKIV